MATGVQIPPRGFFEGIFGIPDYQNIEAVATDLETDIDQLEGWQAGFNGYFHATADGHRKLIPAEKQHFATNYRGFSDRLITLEKKEKKLKLI